MRKADMNTRLIIVFFTLPFLASWNSFAQREEHPARVQLENYRQTNLQEKVFVHTDRNFYLTGDHLWLKIYVVDASFNKPLNLSKVVYVEVLDDQDQAVLSAKVGIENAMGHTALFLPATLNSGNYTLRAYTRWMKNYSPDFFFHKSITVVNPFKPLGLQAREAEYNLDVQFFPEGGHLVKGLESKVGFRVVDQSGKGLKSFHGEVLSQHNDTVASFSPTRFGLGSFEIIPEDGVEYHAVIADSTGNVIARKALPQASDKGYVLSIRDQNGSKISLDVVSNLSPDETGGSVTLLMHSNLAAVRTVTSRLVAGRATFEVEKAGLADGITHFTLFGSDDRPLCERLYFKTPERLLNIDVKADREIVPPRSKITLNLATGDNGSPLPANLSVSVFKVDSLQKEEELNIANYLLLAGDLPGAIESPAYYLSGAPDAAECADNLMLTHGWRRFTWEEISDDDRKPLSLVPEYRGHLITGRLLDEGGEPATGIAVYLSVPGKRFHFTGTKSKADGGLIFELPDFYGPGRVIAQTNWTVDSTYRIVLDEPFSKEISTRFRHAPLMLDHKIQSTLLSRSVSMQVDNAYLEEQKNRRLPPDIDTLMFYRTPDQRYFLDDYTRFGVMEEVMREYVSTIMVRKRRDQFYFRTLNKKNNELFSHNPLVLLDGVPVFDINSIMAYDPLKVWRLQVVASRYYYGKLSFTGIVSYSTYTGDLPDFPLDERALVKDYEGMSWQREFYSPVYEIPQQIESRIPDYRTVLHWAPEVSTGTDGNTSLTFYSGDVPGKYMVSVQGLTTSGMPGTARKVIEVAGGDND